MAGHHYIRAAAILLALIMLSCSQYGEARRPSAKSTRVTLTQLQNSWQKYFIYYSTRVVVFDPVNDDKTVEVHGDWILLNDAEKLSEILSRLVIGSVSKRLLRIQYGCITIRKGLRMHPSVVSLKYIKKSNEIPKVFS